VNLLNEDPKKLANMVMSGSLQLDEVPTKNRSTVAIFVAQLKDPDGLIGDPDDTVEVKKKGKTKDAGKK
jgi:hypothetical protein